MTKISTYFSSCSLLVCEAVQCCGRIPAFWRTWWSGDGGSEVLWNIGVVP